MAERWLDGLYDPVSGRFKLGALAYAIAARGLTPEEFARRAQIARSTIYKAIGGAGVRQAIAIKILRTLRALDTIFADSGAA